MISSATDFYNIVFTENEKKTKKTSKFTVPWTNNYAWKDGTGKNSFQKSWLVRFTTSVDNHLTTKQWVPVVFFQLQGLKCILNRNSQSIPSLLSGHIFTPFKAVLTPELYGWKYDKLFNWKQPKNAFYCCTIRLSLPRCSLNFFLVTLRRPRWLIVQAKTKDNARTTSRCTMPEYGCGFSFPFFFGFAFLAGIFKRCNNSNQTY